MGQCKSKSPQPLQGHAVKFNNTHNIKDMFPVYDSSSEITPSDLKNWSMIINTPIIDVEKVDPNILERYEKIIERYEKIIDLRTEYVRLCHVGEGSEYQDNITIRKALCYRDITNYKYSFKLNIEVLKQMNLLYKDIQKLKAQQVKNYMPQQGIQMGNLPPYPSSSIQLSDNYKLPIAPRI